MDCDIFKWVSINQAYHDKLAISFRTSRNLSNEKAVLLRDMTSLPYILVLPLKWWNFVQMLCVHVQVQRDESIDVPWRRRHFSLLRKPNFLRHLVKSWSREFTSVEILFRWFLNSVGSTYPSHPPPSFLTLSNTPPPPLQTPPQPFKYPSTL